MPCWLWNGNTPLHEWQTTEEEPLINIITWVFENGSFVPTARITDKGSQSIVTDYLGTPTQMYDVNGNKTWEAQLDIYGRVRTFAGSSLGDCPFRYQGQYEDEETGLYYNRFRYYDSETGSYISQDPIGLAGGNPTIYGYVKDVNSWVDVYGLNVQTGAGRTSVKYTGIKNVNGVAKPYHGYASAPTNLGLTPDEIVSRRYGGDFSGFDGGVAPVVNYSGEGVKGKQTARGLEQQGFIDDGGLKGTANRQSPVGDNNPNKQKYADAADEHNNTKIKGGHH